MNWYQFSDKFDALVESDTWQTWEMYIYGTLIIILIIRVLFDRIRRKAKNEI